jgi:hypothetical protein
MKKHIIRKVAVILYLKFCNKLKLLFVCLIYYHEMKNLCGNTCKKLHKITCNFFTREFRFDGERVTRRLQGPKLLMEGSRQRQRGLPL